MLDKSIPYAGLYMRREPGAPKIATELPEGFRFRCYVDGDEEGWARIEASVLEFQSQFAALMYFKEFFIPHKEQLYDRCLFIEKQGGTTERGTTERCSAERGTTERGTTERGMTERGTTERGTTEGGSIVATATAWWTDINGVRRPWLYWVGVDPEYQGLGLGKAVIARATDMLAGFYGRTPIFLKTQTWSYKAVGIYRKCGYVPTDEKALYRNPRDNYKKAMKILRRI